MMNLYRLTTTGLGDFYLVAETPNDAQDLLTSKLKEADYGYDSKRKVVNISLLAEEIGRFADKPFFASGNTLIIANKKPSPLDNWELIKDKIIPPPNP